MVLKSTTKYPIIRHCHNFKNILINDFQHHLFLMLSKSFVNIVPEYRNVTFRENKLYVQSKILK